MKSSDVISVRTVDKYLVDPYLIAGAEKFGQKQYMTKFKNFYYQKFIEKNAFKSTDISFLIL